MLKTFNSNDLDNRLCELRNSCFYLKEESVELIFLKSNLLKKINKYTHDNPISLFIKNLFNLFKQQDQLITIKEKLLKEQNRSDFNIKYLRNLITSIKYNLQTSEDKSIINQVENTLYNEVLVPTQKTYLNEVNKIYNDLNNEINNEIKKIESYNTIDKIISCFSKFLIDAPEIELDEQKLNFINIILNDKYPKTFEIKLNKKISLVLSSIKLFLSDYTKQNHTKLQENLVNILSNFLLSISKQYYENISDSKTKKLIKTKKILLRENNTLKNFIQCCTFLGDCCESEILNSNKEYIDWQKIRESFNNSETCNSRQNINITNISDYEIDQNNSMSEQEIIFAKSLIRFNKNSQYFEEITNEKILYIEYCNLTTIKEKSFAELSGYKQMVDFFTITGDEIEMFFEIDGNTHFKGKEIPVIKTQNNINCETKIRNRIKEILIARRYENRLLKSANNFINNAEIAKSIDNDVKLAVMSTIGTKKIKNGHTYNDFTTILIKNNPNLAQKQNQIETLIKIIGKNIYSEENQRQFKNIKKMNLLIAKNGLVDQNIFIINASHVDILDLSNTIDNAIEKIVNKRLLKSSKNNFKIEK